MRAKVYLAAASREWKRAKRIADELHAHTGCIYEVPWWLTAAEWTGTDARLPRSEQERIAIADMAAINDADLVWVLWPMYDGRSALETEMGIALCNGAPLIVSGMRASESVFTSLANVRESSDEVAMIEAVRLIGGRR